MFGCESVSIVTKVSEPVSACIVEKGSTEEYYVTKWFERSYFTELLAGQDDGCA